ncbi:MAG: T9SS type A sorting domain-containing protein [Bacteroidetes bacterium]|nr:T9SS type A sorting domain-containing protein [Bacteroidota bacterium]MCW5896598.1 T9SS type A sorting domain-containing protein [Bacteroidota bacterium]
MAYVANPLDSGSTPFGVSLLDPSSSARITFQRFPLSGIPNSDAATYDMMSSGGIAPDEFPSLSDTRFLLAIGPFHLAPYDTMRFALAIVCAYNLTGLQSTAIQALNLYNSFVLSTPSTENGVPSEFFLAQNYPNPFNPTTTITYQLPVVADVTLTVYDMLGREVATLVNGRRNAGNHSVQFDATGQASGVYFYKLQAGSFVQTKRMLLVR